MTTGGSQWGGAIMLPLWRLPGRGLVDSSVNDGRAG